MAGSASRVRRVLSSRDFRWLLCGRLVSQVGDGLFQAVVLASVVFSPEKHNTAAGVAQAVAILAVPYSVVGPFAGVFIDRFSRRAILVGTPVVRAACALLVLAGSGAAVPFYAGALLVFSGNRFFLTTAGAVQPRVVPAEELLVANSITTVGGNLATFLGVIVGSNLADVDAIGFRPVVGLTAAIWLVVPFVVRRIRSSLAPVRDGTREALGTELLRVAGELRDGARRLVRTQRALAAVTSITVEQLVQGLLFVISLVVFRERFREGVASYSWIVAAGGAGLFAGLLVVAPLEARLQRRRLLALAFVVSGLPLTVIAFDISRFTVLGGSFLLGLAFPWKKVPADTMVQESIPDAFRGRVFAIYDVTNNMARVLAAVACIGLLGAFSVTTVVAIAGGLSLVWVAVILRWLRRASTLNVRMYAGGRADETPRAVEMGGVEEPVEVERSWREERSGDRLVCFRLRLPDGSRIEVSRPEDGDRWRLDRELRT